MRLSRLALIAAALVAAAGSAHALEYRSVGSSPAILYDAPSAKGRRVFVAPRGMPVEVVLTYGEWTKVRDAAGDLAWVETRALAARRTVVVNAAAARVHQAPDEASPVVFSASQGVLMDMLEPVNAGWVRVRHADGQGGFVRAGEVWGE